MPKITVTSVKHLLELTTDGHHRYDLKIKGMKVPHNFKEIRYYGKQFHIKHELAEQEQAIFPHQIINHELSQIGTGILHHNLICIK
jgi:hypothetical protein